MQGLDDLAPGRHLSIADAAELLGLSVAETLEIVRSGELPAIRTGRGSQWRIGEDALQGYLADQSEQRRRMSLFEQSDFASIAELGDHHRTRRT